MQQTIEQQEMFRLALALLDFHKINSRVGTASLLSCGCSTNRRSSDFERGHEGTEVAGEPLLRDHLATIKALHTVLVERHVRPASMDNKQSEAHIELVLI